jgi:chromosome partitioning protein
MILTRLLAPLVREYDWIIIDLPAQLGLLTANALTAADRVLVPMSCDAYSADGLQQMLNFVNEVQLYNKNLELIGVLITRYNRRRMVDSIVSEELDKAWDGNVFKTRIRENTAISKAPLVKKDILAYDPKSNGAIDYVALCDEIRTRFS